jgi:uncharacterized protein YihD (DUF1040 family)
MVACSWLCSVTVEEWEAVKKYCWWSVEDEGDIDQLKGAKPSDILIFSDGEDVLGIYEVSGFMIEKGEFGFHYKYIPWVEDKGLHPYRIKIRPYRSYGEINPAPLKNYLPKAVGSLDNLTNAKMIPLTEEDLSRIFQALGIPPPSKLTSLELIEVMAKLGEEFGFKVEREVVMDDYIPEDLKMGISKWRASLTWRRGSSLAAVVIHLDDDIVAREILTLKLQLFAAGSIDPIIIVTDSKQADIIRFHYGLGFKRHHESKFIWLTLDDVAEMLENPSKAEDFRRRLNTNKKKT